MSESIIDINDCDMDKCMNDPKIYQQILERYNAEYRHNYNKIKVVGFSSSRLTTENLIQLTKDIFSDELKHVQILDLSENRLDDVERLAPCLEQWLSLNDHLIINIYGNTSISSRRIVRLFNVIKKDHHRFIFLHKFMFNKWIYGDELPIKMDWKITHQEFYESKLWQKYLKNRQIEECRRCAKGMKLLALRHPYNSEIIWTNDEDLETMTWDQTVKFISTPNNDLSDEE